MNRSLLLPALTLPALTLAALLLFATLGLGGRNLMTSGLSYPWLGLAHLLAAIGVGVWAARLGGHGPVVLPVAFVLGVGMGLVLALEEVPLLLGVSPMVWASVLALTFATICAVRVPLGDAVGVAVLFGLYHGQALGGELEAETLLFEMPLALSLVSPPLLEAGVGLNMSRTL